jgi:hypothetical protein
LESISKGFPPDLRGWVMPDAEVRARGARQAIVQIVKERASRQDFASSSSPKRHMSRRRGYIWIRTSLVELPAEATHDRGQPRGGFCGCEWEPDTTMHCDGEGRGSGPMDEDWRKWH